MLILRTDATAAITIYCLVLFCARADWLYQLDCYVWFATMEGWPTRKGIGMAAAQTQVLDWFRLEKRKISFPFLCLFSCRFTWIDCVEFPSKVGWIRIALFQACWFAASFFCVSLGRCEKFHFCAYFTCFHVKHFAYHICFLGLPSWMELDCNPIALSCLKCKTMYFAWRSSR